VYKSIITNISDSPLEKNLKITENKNLKITENKNLKITEYPVEKKFDFYGVFGLKKSYDFKGLR